MMQGSITKSSSSVTPPSSGPLHPAPFNAEYSGHPVDQLRTLVHRLAPSSGEQKRRKIIWLAGDSSLDNKYWLGGEKVPCVNGYEEIFSPPWSSPDVAYALNVEAKAAGGAYCAVNCAVEETTLKSRRKALLPQDEVIRENIQREDVLVVSIGCNDIVLAPNLATMWNMMLLNLLHNAPALEARPGSVWGLRHFERLFRDQVQAYIERILEGKPKPAAVLVCMIYYPGVGGSGWADRVLGFLKYHNEPQRLQAIIKALFERATCNIKIEGCRVVPVPLFEALDGSDERDYVSRVEPSASGGRKMAKKIASLMYSNLGPQSTKENPK